MGGGVEDGGERAAELGNLGFELCDAGFEPVAFCAGGHAGSQSVVEQVGIVGIVDRVEVGVSVGVGWVGQRRRSLVLAHGGVVVELGADFGDAASAERDGVGVERVSGFGLGGAHGFVVFQTCERSWVDPVLVVSLGTRDSVECARYVPAMAATVVWGSGRGGCGAA